ncbi:MAG: hypothetical protein IJN46_06920 [Lachnospiraceae bacterium]|nr:hypothetical protein [Lachnospiraceae bacterium]MBQ6875951.1 hypothetical protein [Lachnospiraceae bacterium]
MGRPESFMEDLENLLTLAAANGFCLTKGQVEDAFKGYALSADQMEMINQYLSQNHVLVESEDYIAEMTAKAEAEENTQSGTASHSGNNEVQEEDEEDSAYYKMYMADLSALPRFSKVREEEQLRQLLAGDTSVGKALIEGRLRFAAKTAALYRGQGVLLMDLIQEANMALVMAVSMYEGGSFEELILTEIKRAIEDALAEAGSQADVGGYLASQVNSLMIVTARLAEELGREATLSELSEKMHMPEEKVRELVKMAMDAMTLQEGEKISSDLS